MDNRRPMPTSATEKAERRARSSYRMERKAKLNSFAFTIYEQVGEPEKREGTGRGVVVVTTWKKLSEHKTHAAAKAELARLEGEPS